MRPLIATLALATALAVGATLAVAAPGAFSPTRTAAVAEYCPPGELEAREAALERAQTRLAEARAATAKFRARQLKTRAKVKNAKARAKLVRAQDKAYARKLRNLRAFEDQVARAQAQLDRCD